MFWDICQVPIEPNPTNLTEAYKYLFLSWEDEKITYSTSLSSVLKKYLVNVDWIIYILDKFCEVVIKG